MIKKILSQYYKLIYFGFFCLLIFLVGIRFLSMLSISDSSYNFNDRDSSKLYPAFPITQRFTASKDNLNQIKIALGSVDLKDKYDKISLELSDESCTKIIAKTYITRHSWRFPIFDRLSFPTIYDSQGKTYCVKVTYFTKSDIKKSDYPRVLIDKNILFGEPFKNTRPKANSEESSLMMRPSYTKGSIFSNLNILKDRISQDKPFFLKNNYLIFYSISFILLTISLVFFIIFYPLGKK